MESEKQPGMDRARRRSVFVSFSALQFTFWAGMGSLAFNTQLLKSCGFDSGEVGLLLALGFLAGMIAPPVWGYIADRIGSVKHTLIMVVILTIAAMVLLPLSRLLFVGLFPTIAVMYPLYSLIRAPVVSLLDSWTVSECNKVELTYSHIRLFGSLGYSLMASTFTWVATLFGIAAPYYAGAAILGVLAFLASHQSGQKRKDRPVQMDNSTEGVRLSPWILFKNYYFVVFLFFNVALTISMNSTISFLPYLLEDIGVSETFTGVVGGARAACEIPVMLMGHKLIKRFKLSTMIGAVGVIYVLCQFSYQLVNSLPSVMLVQCIQGFGYGLFLSSAVQYAFTLAPENLRATAQSLITTTMCMGSIITSLLCGWLIDIVGIRGMFLVTAVIIVSCVVLYIGSFPFGKHVLKLEQNARKEAA